MFFALLGTTDAGEPAGKIEFLSGFDILPVAELLEKKLSGVAERGYRIVYGKSGFIESTSPAEIA